MALFDLPPLPEPPTKLSADARRTQRAREAIAKGRHPLSKLPLANNGRMCGGCLSAFRVDYHNRMYWKCEKVGDTHGGGTDLRKWWPACTAFKAKP